jgi:hypothetical protein
MTTLPELILRWSGGELDPVGLERKPPGEYARHAEVDNPASAQFFLPLALECA